MKTTDAAQGKWMGVLMHFGIEAEYLRNRHGPCPLCGGKDRFRFDDKGGNGTWYCNACGSGTGISLLMEFKGWDFRTAASEVDAVIGNIQVTETTTKDSVSAVERLRRIAKGMGGMDSINPVRLYLHSRRLPATKAVKFHPGISYFDDGEFIGRFPAMVCLVESADGKPLTYHITYLTSDGRKANVPVTKKLMPAAGPLAGGAIRLANIAPHIGIAEGVETALAVMRDYHIPCWSAANATLLEKFDLPEGVQKVTVFGDNDLNFTGQKAAYCLANRLARVVEVDVMIPTTVGADFADEEPAAETLSR